MIPTKQLQLNDIAVPSTAVKARVSRRGTRVLLQSSSPSSGWWTRRKVVEEKVEVLADTPLPVTDQRCS